MKNLVALEKAHISPPQSLNQKTHSHLHRALRDELWVSLSVRLSKDFLRYPHFFTTFLRH